MAAEYGWKPEYILNELSYYRFKKLTQALASRLEKEIDRELLQKLQQTYELRESILQSSMADYDSISFVQYLKNKKLDDLLARNFKISKSEKEKAVTKAHDNVVGAIEKFGKGGE